MHIFKILNHLDYVRLNSAKEAVSCIRMFCITLETSIERTIQIEENVSNKYFQGKNNNYEYVA